MTGPARGFEQPAGNALVGIHDVQECRLGHDRRVGAQARLHQLRYAEPTVLLINREGDDHLRRAERASRGTNRPNAVEHDRDACLHVARSATEQLSALDLRAERVDGHRIDRNRILVGLEEDGEGRGTGRGVGRNEIVPTGTHCLAAELAGDIAEFVFEERRDPRLVHDLGSQIGAAHRVHRRPADEFSEQLGKRKHPPDHCDPPFSGQPAAPITPQRIPPPELLMKIHEYQAKDLLAAAGANVPRHIVVKSPDEAVAAFDQLAQRRWRGAEGAGSRRRPRRRATDGLRPTSSAGVKFCTNKEKVKSVAEAMLKHRLKTKQTGPDGTKIQTLIVQADAEPAKEFYLGMVLDRAKGVPVLMAMRRRRHGHRGSRGHITRRRSSRCRSRPKQGLLPVPGPAAGL